MVNSVPKDLFLPIACDDVTPDLQLPDRYLFHITLNKQELDEVDALYEEFSPTLPSVSEAQCWEEGMLTASIVARADLLARLMDDDKDGAGDSAMNQFMTESAAPF